MKSTTACASNSHAQKSSPNSVQVTIELDTQDRIAMVIEDLYQPKTSYRATSITMNLKEAEELFAQLKSAIRRMKSKKTEKKISEYYYVVKRDGRDVGDYSTKGQAQSAICEMARLTREGWTVITESPFDKIDGTGVRWQIVREKLKPPSE